MLYIRCRLLQASLDLANVFQAVVVLSLTLAHACGCRCCLCRWQRRCFYSAAGGGAAALSTVGPMRVGPDI